MGDGFDPYYKWLAIPPGEQPPSHYRLLGIPDFESDLEVIRSAVEQRTLYLRTLQRCPRSELAQRLLNEVAAAKVCLLDRQFKADYDEALRRRRAFEPTELRPSPPQPPWIRNRGRRIGALAAAVGIVVLSVWGGRRLSDDARSFPAIDGTDADPKTAAAAPAPVMEPEDSLEVPAEKTVKGIRPRDRSSKARYVVAVAPPEAVLRAEGEGVKVEGQGPLRSVTVEKPDGRRRVRLVLSCPGRDSLEQVFTPQPGEAGALTLELPRKPVPAPSGPPRVESHTIEAGKTLAVTVADSGGDRAAVRYRLDPGAPAGAEVHEKTGRLTWTPTAEQAGANHQLTVSALEPSGWAEHTTFLVTVTKRSPPEGISVDLKGGVSMEMILIPKGEFLMGNAEPAASVVSDIRRAYNSSISVEQLQDEYPAHRVAITRPFYLGRHEVTVAQFRAFVAATGYRTDAESGAHGPRGAVGFDAETTRWDKGLTSRRSWKNPGFTQGSDHPVVCVSWHDAQRFCAWLSEREKQRYRLPSEAEWEYACRAGATTRYHFGDEAETLAGHGNVADAAYRIECGGSETIAAPDRYAHTAPVGKFRPNPFGLYDMHGNAIEWCADWYDKGYYAVAPKENPPGPPVGKDRVARGGSWCDGAMGCRASYRLKAGPAARAAILGFRVARDL